MTVKRVMCVLLLVGAAIVFSGCVSPYGSEDTFYPPPASGGGGGGCH